MHPELHLDNMRTSPESITKLGPNEVFVFGSNLAGRHGAGAAQFALRFGAKYGEGFGCYGQTYAIPTKDSALRTLPVWKIRWYVVKFLEWASLNPDTVFLVTPIGCGLAGKTSEEIAPLFKGAERMDNVFLPASFWKVLNGG